MSAGTVLNKLAETAQHVGESAARNWVDIGEDETAYYRRTLAGLELPPHREPHRMTGFYRPSHDHPHQNGQSR
ncbi:MAG: hypothetical protein HOZ81_22475 [Streptomyces sp.]|nr:hypothetical protein [Streptomyces sp.]